VNLTTKRFRYSILRTVYADRTAYFIRIDTPYGHMDSADLELPELRARVRALRALGDYRWEIGMR
jgi:hypothetical protein